MSCNPASWKAVPMEGCKSAAFCPAIAKQGGDSGNTGDKPINTRGSAVPDRKQPPGTAGTIGAKCPRCPHQQKAGGDKRGGLQRPKTRGVSKIVPEVPAVPTQNSNDQIKTTIENWRSQIGSLPVPDNHNGLHIGTIALHFLSSPHVIKAVGLGWSELELFGLFDSQHPTAPLRRHDAMGLVPSLALSRLGVHSPATTA